MVFHSCVLNRRFNKNHEDISGPFGIYCCTEGYPFLQGLANATHLNDRKTHLLTQIGIALGIEYINSSQQYFQTGKSVKTGTQACRQGIVRCPSLNTTTTRLRMDLQRSPPLLPPPSPRWIPTLLQLRVPGLLSLQLHLQDRPKCVTKGPPSEKIVAKLADD